MTPKGDDGHRVGRLARSFVALVLPRDRWRDVLGDLEEGLRRRAELLGPLALRAWYMRQLGAYACWGLADRLEARRAARADSAGAESLASAEV